MQQWNTTIFYAHNVWYLFAGPNSLTGCTITANGACTNANALPAGIECTLPFTGVKI